MRNTAQKQYKIRPTLTLNIILHTNSVNGRYIRTEAASVPNVRRTTSSNRVGGFSNRNRPSSTSLVLYSQQNTHGRVSPNIAALYADQTVQTLNSPAGRHPAAALKRSARYWAARNWAARKRAARDREQPVSYEATVLSRTTVATVSVLPK